jgi:hypothetical protein
MRHTGHARSGPSAANGATSRIARQMPADSMSSSATSASANSEHQRAQRICAMRHRRGDAFQPDQGHRLPVPAGTRRRDTSALISETGI